jgi:hypothetical protein
MKIHGRDERNPEARAPRGSVSYPLTTEPVSSMTPREIRCPKQDKVGGGRERGRLKLAKRQEVAKAEQRESARRSRREQLVKGALNLRTKRAVRPRTRSSRRARQSPEVREPQDFVRRNPCVFM